MQDIRDLLQQAATNIVALTQAQERTQQQIDSNARSIQAWEALIGQNRVEAEEERSQLRVELNELKQASRENIAQHFDFRERFDQMMSEIRDLRRRMAG